MTAVRVLKAARDAGIRLTIDGDDLVLEASRSPAAEVVDLLSRHKAGIVALLRPVRVGWSAEDWRAFFDERAGVAEFDADLPRREADARAFSCCVAEWLNRNPVHSQPGRCLNCGRSEQVHDPLLPFGTEITGHAWFHGRCWPSWHNARTEEAVAAMADLGIRASDELLEDFGRIGGA
jgi:hypothetical protein